ncbi:hypothetical protein [Zavarzinella formosa]|uniref:hypothetical protein n=1 Tax=Zavarzinella formosa TaxID=360055 RepID=UPI0003163EAB|nr:hypothetical protein [Zavarzinella formosa]
MLVAQTPASSQSSVMSFDVDFLGRLRKVRITAAAPLQALFEAIANAFDATADRPEAGSINVRILRRPKYMPLYDKEPEYELAGFEIEDNGVGFTDENLASFKKSDSTHKSAGKGVGRLLWLHIFDRAEIDSVYQQGDARLRRVFTFSKENHGVNDAETLGKPAGDGAVCGTKVRLMAPKSERVKVLNQSQSHLAAKFLEHFLLHFSVMRGQSLTVEDSDGGEVVDVGELYGELIGNRHVEEAFEIRGNTFVLHHLFVKSMICRGNAVNLCANGRLVTSEGLNVLIPEVSRTAVFAVSDQGSLRYQGYVTGAYLDEIADDERTGLKFAPDLEEGEDEDEVGAAAILKAAGVTQDDIEGVSKRELSKEITARVRERLSEHLSEVRRRKEAQLDTFVACEQPQFRPFVELAKKNLERLKGKPSKRAIELVLYEAKIDSRNEMEKLVREIVRESPAHQQVETLRADLIEKISKAANAHNISALAEYVCTRKAVLQVFSNNLGTDDKNENAFESVIHNIIFPQFETSDSLPSGGSGAAVRDIANLWLIDDRLVFHRLLASDKPLHTLRGFLSSSERVPDIVIFDPTFATTDDPDALKSIALIEFKRPGRDDYGPGEKKNPIDQILAIAKDIRRGNLASCDGRKRVVASEVVIYAYIICDLTDTLLNLVEQRSFRPTPDKKGFYSYHDTYNLIVEIISYEKLLLDAKRRNEAFFRLLHLT